MIATRYLGNNGPAVGCLGYGAMVLERYYGTSDDEAAVDTIRCALDVGMTMIDSADAYGKGHNESLIARALKGRRDQAFVATKFGIVFDETEVATDLATGCNASMSRPNRAWQRMQHWSNCMLANKALQPIVSASSEHPGRVAR